MEKDSSQMLCENGKQKNLDTILIISENGMIETRKKNIDDSDKLFLDKVDFYVKCKKYGLSKKLANVYTNIYGNKIKYNVSYAYDIENFLNIIQFSKF